MVTKYWQFFFLYFKNVLYINPYNKHDNGYAEAKHQCMIEHNVKIMDNCDEYINYVNSTYGPELFKNCKRVKRSRKRTKVVIC